MFRAIDPRRAASDTGVEITCLDRRQIRYRRDGHELIVLREPVAGRDLDPVQSVVLAPKLCWLPPHQNEPIDDGMRATIAREIVEAFRAFGIDTEVVGS